MGYVCMFSIIIWSVALGLGVYFLDDAQLTLSSTAKLVSMEDDDPCDCDEDGVTCYGEQYLYQWIVINSTDCANVAFKSDDTCYSSKDIKIEKRKYDIGNNVTWYHDESCDDWSDCICSFLFNLCHFCLVFEMVSFVEPCYGN